MTYADYADYPALLLNTPVQTESKRHSPQQAEGDNNFFVNTNKTEYICFKHKDDISTLSGNPLKLEYQFKYLGTIISSSESDVNENVEFY